MHINKTLTISTKDKVTANDIRLLLCQDCQKALISMIECDYEIQQDRINSKLEVLERIKYKYKEQSE